jgi:ABC-type bacteriocin/lantibiotic exporter with double-glycine peptidase domain
MRNTIKKFFSIIKEDKNKFFLLILPFVFLSFMEAFSIGLLIPFLETLTGNVNNSSKIIDFLNPIIKNKISIEVFLSGLILILFVIKNTLHYFLNKIFFTYCFNIQSKLRIKILRKINLDYFKVNSSVHEINKLVSFSTERFANNMMIPIMFAMPEISLFVLLISILGFYQPVTMLIMLIVILISTFSFLIFFKKKYIIWGKNYTSSSKSLLSSTTNAIHGIEELKILGKENFFSKIAEKYSKKFAFYAVKYRLFQKLPRQFVEIIILIAIVLIFIINKYNYNISQNTILDLTLFGIVGIRLIPVFGQILATVNEIRFGKNSIDEIHSLLNKKSSKINISHKLNKEMINFKSLKMINVKVNNLKNIFKKGLNLVLKKKDFIGIYGKSGVGKSTLLKTLTGMNLNVIKGKILINNNQINFQNHKSLAQKVYLVKQDPLFFEGNLLENIAIGVKKVNIDKVRTCLRASQCDFLFKDKKGLKTKINDGAKNFSTGQKQRMSIARALYFDREIVLFDEITANLDKQNADKITILLNKLSKSKTIILVSHDIDMLKNCKKIYELTEDGLVIKN